MGSSKAIDDVQAATKSDTTESPHGLVDFEQPSGAEDGQIPSDSILDSDAILSEQRLPSGSFIVDDAGHDGVHEAIEQFLFRASECYLVADLIEVAGGFGAFAIVATDGKMQVLGGLPDFFEFSGQPQGGQVEHGGKTNAGSGVRRTC